MTYVNRDYWTRLHRDVHGPLSTVGYPEMGEGFNRETYRLRLGAAERLLPRTLGQQPRRLLEAAAGVGAYAELWTRLGVERWVGVDISAEAVHRLRGRFPKHEFFALDLTSADPDEWAPVVERSPYDLVTAIDVLYHLPADPDFFAALANLARLVRPGGHLLVSDVFPPARVDVAEHVCRRPIGAYEEVVGPLGFSLRGREPVFALLGDPVRQPGFHPRQETLWQVWRAVAKVVRTTPGPFRSAIGALAVRALMPFDALLRKRGWASGVNLELAIFERTGSSKREDRG